MHPVPHAAADRERLGDALELLRRGDRATVDRQQTLAATLAWSHDLLATTSTCCSAGWRCSPAPSRSRRSRRSAARRLGVTRCSPHSPGWWTRRSSRSSTAATATRYRLLETVRQFAAERLRGSRASAPSCAPRTATGTSTSPRRATRERTPAAGSWPRRAWSRARQPASRARRGRCEHQPAAALCLAVAMWRYWLARGLIGRGSALARGGAGRRTRSRPRCARARCSRSPCSTCAGATASRLVELGDEAVRIRRSLDDRSELAAALHAHGAARLHARRVGPVLAARRRGAAGRRRGGPSRRHRGVCICSPWCSAARGRCDEARGVLRRRSASCWRLAGEVERRSSCRSLSGFVVEGSTAPMPRVLLRGDRAARPARRRAAGRRLRAVQPGGGRAG